MRAVAKRTVLRDLAALRGSRARPGCRLPQQPRRPHQQRRGLTSAAPPPPPPSGYAALASRQLLCVSGPDSANFLQGLMTANVLAPGGLPRTDGFYAAFLNATGRVLHDVFVYPFGAGRPGLASDGGGFLVETDAAQMAGFAKYIKRYKLRAKITLRSLGPDEATVWHAWDDAAGALGGVTAAAAAAVVAGQSVIALEDPRAPGLGCRIVQLGGAPPALDLEPSTEDAYTIRRYLHGVAEGQDEMLREQALPLESNVELMKGIDFHKGCYVGQELTIRTKHRGVVRKRILPCVIYARDEAPPQTTLYEPEGATAAPAERLTADMIPGETSIGRSGKTGRSAGRWLRGLGNVGLGLCRLDVMTDVVLPGEPSAAPRGPDDEFELEWGPEGTRRGVKVKAFVPAWLRRALDASRPRRADERP